MPKESNTTYCEDCKRYVDKRGFQNHKRAHEKTKATADWLSTIGMIVSIAMMFIGLFTTGLAIYHYGPDYIYVPSQVYSAQCYLAKTLSAPLDISRSGVLETFAKNMIETACAEIDQNPDGGEKEATPGGTDDHPTESTNTTEITSNSDVTTTTQSDDED